MGDNYTFQYNWIQSTPNLQVKSPGATPLPGESAHFPEGVGLLVQRLGMTVYRFFSVAASETQGSGLRVEGLGF